MPKLIFKQEPIDIYDPKSAFRLITEIDEESASEDNPSLIWVRQSMIYANQITSMLDLHDNDDTRDLVATFTFNDKDNLSESESDNNCCDCDCDPFECDDDYCESDYYFNENEFESIPEEFKEMPAVSFSYNSGDAYQRIGGMASPQIVASILVLRLLEDALKQSSLYRT